MPSLHKTLIQRILIKLFCMMAVVLLLVSVVNAQDSTARPTEAQVNQAIKKLKADPNLAIETKINSLRWMQDKDKKEEKQKIPGWLRWIQKLFEWLAQTSRLLLWTIITILVAIVVVFLLRLFRNYQISAKLPASYLPSHVRDLDIRPESLPDDIGAAAWELWQQNNHRAALSLLYRGLLSRLVHQHLVPIRDSSTESQCLKLARVHLQSSQTDYVSRMLKLWQFAVYGAQLPDGVEVQQLCEQFSAALDQQYSIEHSA